MAGRIGMRTGEAMVEGDIGYICAEPEIVIGELDGPVGLGHGHVGRRPSERSTLAFCQSSTAITRSSQPR